MKSQYSASVGSPQAALLHNIWATPIQGDKDPNPHMARNQSAHAQINSGGENLSDCMLAYAMTMALPESYATIKQTLWLQKNLASADVAGAVQAESSQRRTIKSGNALAVQHKAFNKKSNFKPNPNFPAYPCNNNAYCNFHHTNGHATKDCISKKRKEQGTGQMAAKNEPDNSGAANFASNFGKVIEISDKVINYDSNGSAFLSSSVLPPSDTFICWNLSTLMPVSLPYSIVRRSCQDPVISTRRVDTPQVT